MISTGNSFELCLLFLVAVAGASSRAVRTIRSNICCADQLVATTGDMYTPQRLIMMLSDSKEMNAAVKSNNKKCEQY